MNSLDQINVKMLINHVKNDIDKVLTHNLFEYNDQTTRNNIKSTISNYLKPLRDSKALNEFKVICDETNNTPQLIDDGMLKLDCYIQPSKSASFINFSSVLDPNFEKQIHDRYPSLAKAKDQLDSGMITKEQYESIRILIR